MLYLFLLFFLVSNFYCNAQNLNIKRTWHWYFGNGAGIDFSSGTAVADTTGHLHTYEGCATMSDTLGNLLFYTDGDTVWDRNHNAMPNGHGLYGACFANLAGSTAQAAIIVPFPGNSNQYFIVTNDCQENAGALGLRYTVINMTLHGGNGDVDTLQKNILLYAPGTEGVSATFKCNKKDYWIVAHEFGNNNFRVYSVDSNGINLTPQIISIGSNYFIYQFCMFRFSSDGSKLASAFSSQLPINDLFDFDIETGIISNYIQLTGFGGEYAPEFSFDNSKLYYTTSGNIIYQYDLTSNDSAIINSSRIIVSNVQDNSTYESLSKAPDGKIYVSSFYYDSLSTIDFPDVYGTGCFVNTFSFSLVRQSLTGLPNSIPDFYDQSELLNDCKTGISELYLDSIQVFPNPAYDWIQIEGKEIKSMILTDIYGNIIAEADGTAPPPTIMNTKTFHRGLYLLRIKTKNKIILKKIILN